MFFFRGGFRLGRISTAAFAPSAEWAETLLLLRFPQMHEGYVTNKRFFLTAAAVNHLFGMET